MSAPMTPDRERQIRTLDLLELMSDRSAVVVSRALADVLDEVERLRSELAEMTHCRDNALRALYRDDVETDIDLEETIEAPFYGPGWDWGESDLRRVVREAVSAVRPAFGKLTQQRDTLRAALAARPTRAEVLSDAERAMLTYALDQAQEDIWSRDGFTDEDQAALTSLRRLADAAAGESGASRPGPAAVRAAIKGAVHNVVRDHRDDADLVTRVTDAVTAALAETGGAR